MAKLLKVFLKSYHFQVYKNPRFCSDFFFYFVVLDWKWINHFSTQEIGKVISDLTISGIQKSVTLQAVWGSLKYLVNLIYI